MRRHAADLALAAGFGGGGGLATLALFRGDDGPSLPAVALGFGAGLFLGLAPWRRLRRWLDDRLARRPAHWPRLGFASGLVFLFVFTGQCELQEVSAPAAAPWLPFGLAAGLLGLWSAFFLAAAPPPQPPGREGATGTNLAPGLRGTTLGLGAAFGLGSLASASALSLVYGGAPGWSEVREAAGLGAGVLVGFPAWRWVGRRFRFPGPAASRHPFHAGSVRCLLVGFLAGGVTVAALAGWTTWAWSLFHPAPWHEELLGNTIRGLWNACLLGCGFGFLIPDRAPAPRP